MIVLLVILIGFGMSINAQGGDTEIRDAGTVVVKNGKTMSRDAHVIDPYTEFNDLLLPERTLVIRVELRKMGNGQQFVFRTVRGYLSPSTGTRVNEFDSRTQMFYQRIYGGRFSEYIYDNRPSPRDTRM